MIYKFDDIIGNISSIQLIKRALESDSFPHLSIMGGVMGTGKSSTAKAVALALTCDTVREHLYEPCCDCIACKNAIASFTSTGKSSYIKIFNAGQMTKIDDVKDMIDQIFVRDNGLHNNVYIIEEAHVLATISNAQTILLDELDRMPSNSYLILTTTNTNKILKTIRSRAITFNFHRLSMSEARVFIDRICDSKGYVLGSSKDGYCSSAEIADLIAANSQGIPRDIERSIDFISSTNPTRTELLDFFQQISDDELLNLILSASQQDALLYSNTINALCDSYEPDIVVRSFKDFVAKKYFEVMSDSIHSKLLSDSQWDELIRFASTLTEECTSADLKVKLLYFRMRLLKLSPADLAHANPTKGKQERSAGVLERRAELIHQNTQSTAAEDDELTMSTLFGLQKGGAKK